VAPSPAQLAHAVELERRDEAIATELATVTALAQRTESIRARAANVRDALERHPLQLEELTARRRDADADEVNARAEVSRAEEALARLESSRRHRVEETERARKEIATAQNALADTRAYVQRLEEQRVELEGEHASLRAEAAGLVDRARSVADEVRGVDRITEGARREPAASLDELDDWGGQARSALFVARGTLEAERERVVVEANALGSAVLGEPLGASSAALVLRRLERARDG